MENTSQTTERNYTMMNVKRTQLRRIKVAAALRGKTMVDLLDEMLDHIEKQNGKPTTDSK